MHTGTRLLTIGYKHYIRSSVRCLHDHVCCSLHQVLHEDGALDLAHYIMVEGQLESDMFVIAEGTVKLERRKKPLGKLREFDIFGELGASDCYSVILLHGLLSRCIK